MSFPSLLQLKLRIEVPLWRNVAGAKHSPADPQSEGSDTDSPASGSKERSPRYAQPVPVGGAELPEAEAEEATEEEDTVAEPTYTFAQGFGRFVIRYTRLATALGNFEQGSIQTESTVARRSRVMLGPFSDHSRIILGIVRAAVAHWLTSGLKVAMSRVGWNLLSPRYGLTRLSKDLLRLYYSHGYPQVQEDDRPYHQYGPIVYREDRWDQLCGWLSGDPTFRRTLERHKQALRDQQGVSRDDSTSADAVWAECPGHH